MMFKLAFFSLFIITSIISSSRGENPGYSLHNEALYETEQNTDENNKNDEVSVEIKTLDNSSLESKNVETSNKNKSPTLLPNDLKLISKYPSKVVLHYIKNKKDKIKNRYNLCGGVLITSQRVLTSSNCFYHDLYSSSDYLSVNKDAKNYRISLFADTLTSNWKNKMFKIKKIIIQPSLENGDIAIVELGQEILITPTKNHAWLPEFGVTIDKNLSTIQQAHESIQKNPNDSVNKLKIGIIHVSNSHTLHLSNDSDFHTLFFADYKSHDTGICYMLLGDPVYNSTDTVVGILQVVHNCKDASYPFVFTDIFMHKSWIANALITGFP